MTKRIFVAAYLAETNTFAPFPTDKAAFRDLLWFDRDEAVSSPSLGDPCYEYITRAQALGWEVIAGLRTFAEPGGLIPQDVYRELRDNILDHLRTSLPVDAVLLAVHGAMVAEGEFDGEGDLIARCRGIVGDNVPIGVHHDPHAHLTRKMVDNADVIRIWKEYPHTDIAQRCGEVFELIKARLEGAPRAIPVLEDCPMTQPLHTTRDPMMSFVAKCTALEGNYGIQGINIAHSFPWGDVPDMGTRVLVYAESPADLRRAEALATQLSDELWDMKEACRAKLLTIDEALDKACAASSGPVVISDGSDNPGGGAPADATYFLQRLLGRDESSWAIGYLWDPVAAEEAMKAGIGAQLQLSVGGNICELSGEPVDVEVRVTGIKRNCSQRFGDLRLSSGDAVSLDLGKDRFIVLLTKRQQVFDPVIFDELDVDIDSKQTVVVKSSQHFHSLFAPRASEVIYAAGPGVLTPHLNSLHYEHADTSLWPIGPGRTSAERRSD